MDIFQLKQTVEEVEAMGGNPLEELAQQLMQELSEKKIEWGKRSPTECRLMPKRTLLGTSYRTFPVGCDICSPSSLSCRELCEASGPAASKARE